MTFIKQVFDPLLYRDQIREFEEKFEKSTTYNQIQSFSQITDYVSSLNIDIISDFCIIPSSILLYGNIHTNKKLLHCIETLKQKTSSNEIPFIIDQTITISIPTITDSVIKMNANCESSKQHQDASMQLKKDNRILVYNEENIPFFDNQFFLICSNLSLNFVNDLNKTLLEYSRILKPKGMVIINIIGGASLNNLRQAFYYADLACYSGANNRIMPMIMAESLAKSCYSSGFSSVIVEKNRLNLSFSHLSDMIKVLYYSWQVPCMIENNLKTSNDFWRKSIEYFHNIFENSIKNEIQNHCQTFANSKTKEYQPSNIFQDSIEVLTLIAVK